MYEKATGSNMKRESWGFSAISLYIATQFSTGRYILASLFFNLKITSLSADNALTCRMSWPPHEPYRTTTGSDPFDLDCRSTFYFIKLTCSVWPRGHIRGLFLPNEKTVYKGTFVQQRNSKYRHVSIQVHLR